MSLADIWDDYAVKQEIEAASARQERERTVSKAKKAKSNPPKPTAKDKRLCAAVRAVFGEDITPVAMVLGHDDGELELVRSPAISLEMLRALIGGCECGQGMADWLKKQKWPRGLSIFQGGRQLI